MSAYTPAGRVPASELRAGHVINAQQVFDEWPVNSGLLSPPEADNCGPVNELQHCTVETVERYTQGLVLDALDMAPVQITSGQASFLVEPDQMIQLFTEENR